MGVIKTKAKGFTLVEILLVLVIFGLFLAVVLPRASRAQLAGKYSEVRMQATEIAGYVVTWAEQQARNQPPDKNFTLRDFLYEDIIEPDLRFKSAKLSGKYTGNEAYAPIQTMAGKDKPPLNPFNQVSYFAKANDDVNTPSPKPGLLYLAAAPDARAKDYLMFYFLFTSTDADESGSLWYGGQRPEGDEIRRGVFVARLYNERNPRLSEPRVEPPQK